jgi:hypothetical protein
MNFDKLRVMKFVILSLFITLKAFAGLDCSKFSELSGCLYKPEKITSKKLLIYFRGHFESKAPPYPSTLKDRQRSIKECLDTYNLKIISEENEMLILFSSVADHFFSVSDIEQILKEYELSEIIIASHSGSYRVLNTQIKLLSQVKEIYLLDNFYASSEVANELGNMIKDLKLNCRGFLTNHNLKRYISRYQKNLNCTVEMSDKFDHITSVKTCLSSYLANGLCAPELKSKIHSQKNGVLKI